MLKRISGITLLAVAAMLANPLAAFAAATSDSKAVATKKKSSKKSAKAAAPLRAAIVETDEEASTDGTSTDFQCELGNKLTIYNHVNDEQHVALRWKNRLLQLTKVDTSTGATRYESAKHGLVWIGIPTKSMLLDTKKGQQLANECKNAEQLKPPVPAEVTEVTTPVKG